MHAVILISRFMEKPKDAHWQAAKRILRYVKGTKRFGIFYTTSENSELIGYTDSDWVGSIDDRKSTSSYVFHMGSGAISWSSKKQPIVALSTAKAEYVAATTVACQAVWMRRMLKKVCQEQIKGTVIHYDNSSTIAISKNSVFHKRKKHIDTKFHFIHELVSNGEIVLQHCRTEDQFADILTKPLAQNSFNKFKKCLGMQENPTVEIKGECWNLISNYPYKLADIRINWKGMKRQQNGGKLMDDVKLKSWEMNAEAVEEPLLSPATTTLNTHQTCLMQ